MNQMKFMAAIFAVAFVIVGSAFTAKKTNAIPYGFEGKTQFLGNVYTYSLVDLSEHTTGSCISTGAACKVDIDPANFVSGTESAHSGGRFTVNVDQSNASPEDTDQYSY